MADINLIFNDKPISVPSGLTILEVARRQGVEIPTLCHDDRMVPFGSCFVCIVEVVGARSFQPACATRVSPGMQIRTDSQQIQQVRKMALSLLLSNHYADCKAPCTLKCPAGVDVQGYIGLIANHQYREALALIKETNPFPLSLGRICTRPCEGVCRRGLLDEPVGIDYLKRFVADYDLNSEDPYLPEKKPAKSNKIAVIGAGPGGLSAAYYMAAEGYPVTVFEQHGHPGGMLRWGIPEYRLPKKILDAEVGLIRQLGIEIRYHQALGRDFSLEELRSRGYDVILLAIGAQAGLGMRVKGEELPGVMIGVDFLHSVVKGEINRIGRRVAVIGGGNTAMDAARTSLRLGAEKVMIIYRRTRDEIPANDIEIEEAIEEGIEFIYLTAPVEITGQGRAESIRCIRMELGEPDHSGRRRPVPVQGSEYDIPVDTVIAAIGQSVDLSGLSRDSNLPAITKWNTLQVNEQTMQTSIPWIFAVGDAVTGPQAAIDAIGGAGKAVKAIVSYLQAGTVSVPRPEFIIRKDQFKPVTADDLGEYPHLPRQKMNVLSPAKRKRNFHEIEAGYTEKQALLEAERCLECGCQDLFECKLRQYAGEYQADISMFCGSHKKITNDNYHPYIRIEPNKCINCGRCVRICDEVQHLSVWGFVKRGFDTLIQPSFQEPLLLTQCETCGQCIQTCPTGALSEKNPGPAKPGPFKTRSRFDVCRYCSVGCGLEIHYTGGKIQRITGRDDARNNHGNLCFKGRFGYESLQDDAAITTPWARKNGRLVPIDFDEAIRIIESGLKLSPSMQFILGESLPQEIYRAVHTRKHPLFSFAEVNYSPLIQSIRAAGLENHFGAPAAVWDSASTFILLDADLQKDHPVLLLDIMQHLRNGARLVSVQANPDSKLKEFLKTGQVLSLDKPAASILPALNRRVARKIASLSPDLKSLYGSASRSESSAVLDQLAEQLLNEPHPVILIVGRLNAAGAMHLANLAVMSGRSPEQLR
ncbi:MAG: FAD-dependent oxidoreductase, partial [Candidatus Delongbacteria bacterium]|nr:FAD-dependent oxidoreductase [Candidatus Delongbacteria bacterium]